MLDAGGSIAMVASFNLNQFQLEVKRYEGTQHNRCYKCKQFDLPKHFAHLGRFEYRYWCENCEPVQLVKPRKASRVGRVRQPKPHIEPVLSPRKPNLPERIMKALEETGKPLLVSELPEMVSASWKYVRESLRVLEKEGRIVRRFYDGWKRDGFVALPEHSDVAEDLVRSGAVSDGKLSKELGRVFHCLDDEPKTLKQMAVLLPGKKIETIYTHLSILKRRGLIGEVRYMQHRCIYYQSQHEDRARELVRQTRLDSLPPTQQKLYAAICQNPGIRRSELIALTNTHADNMTHNLRWLEGKELIERRIVKKGKNSQVFCYPIV